MRKKTILIYIILLFLIIAVAYVFNVNKNKEKLNGTGSISDNSNLCIYTANDLEKKTLLNIKVALISTDIHNNQSINGGDLETFKKNAKNLQLIECNENVTIIVKDDKNNEINKFEMDPSKDFSKWITLEKGKSYTIYLYTDKFMGIYYNESTSYYLY
ncbi:MAG: hypothetical protein GX275_06580 [Clostridiales bacterium]|nr:hypothetical protein [Clostridiales bacterium]